MTDIWFVGSGKTTVDGSSDTIGEERLKKFWFRVED